MHDSGMDDIHETRRKRLSQLIEDKYEGRKADFARAMGFTQTNLVYRLLSASASTHKPMGAALARRVEQTCGKPENWLDTPAEAQIVERSGCALPVMSSAGSMGTGIQADHDTVVGSIRVSEEWLRRELPSSTGWNNLRVITGYGDSMETTYRDGDILVVDTGVRDVRVDAVYVFRRHDELFIKRLQRRLDGSLLVISDNRKYEPQIVGEREGIQVVGRVLYAWTGHRL